MIARRADLGAGIYGSVLPHRGQVVAKQPNVRHYDAGWEACKEGKNKLRTGLVTGCRESLCRLIARRLGPTPDLFRSRVSIHTAAATG